MESYLLVALARHGQTNSNLNGLWVGRGDDPLNSTGKEQARVLAEELSEFTFDYIISSDKRRSIETAEIISNILEIPLYGQHDILRDRDYGELEGLTSEQIRERYGIEMKALSRELDDLKTSESTNDVLNRVKQFVGTANTQFKGKGIIVITHGAFIRSFYEAYIQKADHLRFTNCSQFIVKFVDGKSILVRDLKTL